MRRKQRRSIILWSLGVLLLLGCYLFLLKQNQENNNQDDGRIVYKLEKDSINRLEFAGRDGQIILVKEQDGWKYEMDKTFLLNERFIESMLDKTAILRADRLVSQGREHFGEYGLEEPSNVIRVDAGSLQKVIYLGNRNSTTGDCYMSVEGSDQIFTVDSTFPTLFSIGINDMASRETLPDMTVETISAFNVETSSGTIQFRKEDNSWMVAQNSEKSVKADESRIQELLSQVIRLRYAEMVQYHPDAEQLDLYGLGEPKIRLCVDFLNRQDHTQQEFILTVGNQTGDQKQYFVYPQPGSGVYTVEAEALEPFLYLAAEDFLSLDIAAIQADTLTGLEIWTDKLKISYKIERGKTLSQPVYHLNGQEIAAADFNAFYYPLYALEADRRVTDMGDQLVEQPVLTIVYERNQKNGGNVTVEFIPYDQNYYGVRTEGKAVLLMNRQKVNQLLAQIQKLGVS